MDLDDYLKEPISVDRPRSSPWLRVGSLDVPSGYLTLADPNLMYQAEPHEPGPGRYEVQIKLADFAGRRLVSGLRVAREEGGVLGDRSRRFIIDSARVGLADAGRFQEVAEPLDDAGYAAFLAGLKGDDLAGILHPDGPSPVVYAATGFGEGSYLARDLIRNGETIGLQVEFVNFDVDDSTF